MAAVTKGEKKKSVTLRVAPAVLSMVDDLTGWVGASSKAWVWESAIIRWHAQEQAKRQDEQGKNVRREAVTNE